MSDVLSREEFFAQYRFDPEKVGWIGVEVEAWTVHPETKQLIPLNPHVLEHPTRHTFKPELPSQQIEFNTTPVSGLDELGFELADCFAELDMLSGVYGFEPVFCPLPPSDFEQIVFPLERYLQIQKHVPAERLRSAWVAGVHLHFGMRSMADAILAVNKLTPKLDEMILSFGVNQARVGIYKKMAGNFAAPKIRDENHFYEIAVESGFVNDPRRCWWLIRVNGVGTVELRFFDSTNDVSLIVSFAREIQAMLS